MKREILCGIDVSAKTLDVALDLGRGPVWTGVFDNNAAGHRQLVRKLLTILNAMIRDGTEWQERAA